LSHGTQRSWTNSSRNIRSRESAYTTGIFSHKYESNEIKWQALSFEISDIVQEILDTEIE